MSHRNGLTDIEKRTWDKACTLFKDMLDDFNSKNLLRKGTLQMDRKRLALIWANSRNYGKAFNEFHKKFETEQTVEELVSNSGLTGQTLTHLFISQMIGTILVYYESVFKTSLLFFLEEERGIRKNMTLGQLLGVIEDLSPSIGARLKAMIDTKLRNSLAHGTFWFKEGKVFLAANSYLEDVEEMKLHELWIQFKELTIIAIAFTEILHQKILEGYFRL